MSTFVLGGMNDVLNQQGYTQAAWVEPHPDFAMDAFDHHLSFLQFPARLRFTGREYVLPPNFADFSFRLAFSHRGY